MRGASALGELLRSVPSPKLRVLVVWEPVIDSDRGPPSAAVLDLVNDPRAIHYWDQQKLLSQEIVRELRENPALLDNPKVELDADTVIWDAIAVFAPGARWERTLPAPAFRGNPVVRAIDGVKATLTRLLQ